MKVSDRAISLLHNFEGLMTKAYKCPAGKWTIGYGHTYNVKPGDVITKDEADIYLKADLGYFETSLTKALNAEEVEITQSQFDALICFAYNVGFIALMDSTLWKKFLKGDLEGVAAEFLRWDKVRDPSTGIKSSSIGLTKRRQAEAQLFLS